MIAAVRDRAFLFAQSAWMFSAAMGIFPAARGGHFVAAEPAVMIGVEFCECPKLALLRERREFGPVERAVAIGVSRRKLRIRRLHARAHRISRSGDKDKKRRRRNNPVHFFLRC
jgi:hypothetical protein